MLWDARSTNVEGQVIVERWAGYHLWFRGNLLSDVMGRGIMKCCGTPDLSLLRGEVLSNVGQVIINC